jgi:mannose-1-phosphate guanylyltransferase/mannose-6-phosphate isomerase
MNTSTVNPNFSGIILAGGSGTRFWPLSRSQYPKQILRLFESESMLQLTIQRLLTRFQPERLGIVLNASQEDVIRLDLTHKGWHDIKLWLEPLSRNTAPAIALAAARLENGADTDVMAVFPVDHHIADENRFFAALDQGAVLAEAGYLVTFGITPNCPDTCYGYIKAGEPLPEHDFGFSVSEFLEKPDADQTKSFLAEGNCYWNSGIFMFRRDVLLQAYLQYLPELYENLISFLEGANPLPSLTEIYEKLPSISIDHGIFARADNVVVLPVDMGWSDVGSWGELFDFLPQDENGNVLLGRVQEQD